MVASVLKRGNVAIVSYATDPIGADGDDIIRFVVLAPIGSGTQIFFSDRNWNGTAFPAASAGEGTFTYTAGADLPAGTVITITSAQLLAAGMDLSNGGDTVYVYQGTDANTPTTFLFAIDFGDGNSVFEAGELTGTGLTAGVDAVAVAHDQASFAGQSTQIPQTQLTAISNNVQWHGHSGDDIGGTIYDDRADTSLSGPLNNPDMQLFGMMSGGGQSDAFIRMDNDEASNVATNLTRLFRDNPAFTHLTDLAFDIEDGFWFAVDNDGGTVTRLVKGNIADLVSGTSTPTITQIYDRPNNDADANDDSFIGGIEIDTVNNQVYFVEGDILNGHNLKRVGYNGGAVSDWGPLDQALDPSLGIFVGGIYDFALDVAHNTAYFTYVLVDTTTIPATAPINYIVRVNSLVSPNPAVENYTIVPINAGDDPDGPGGNPANHFPQVQGSLAGVDIDIANQRLFFVTQRLGADGTAGIFMLDLVTNNWVELWQQQSNNATNTLQPFPTTQMLYIEVDTIGGRYYVSTLNNTDTAVGHDGTATDEGGSRIFSGVLATTAGQPAPTVFASVFENTANGAVLGMEIDYAPTLSVVSAGSTYTESTNLPASPAGPTVDVATSPVVNDVDQTIIQGATVAITTGFMAGDSLTFTNSGGITGSYNATTGVITFTGNASFAAYQTVLDSVRFTNAGDNPTNYGASPSRTISFTVTDGLINSDPATATVAVVGINDAPVDVVPGTQIFNEDVARVFSTANGNALSMSDVDADPSAQALSVTLSVTKGVLTLSSVGGLSFSDGDGTSDTTMTFTGTTAAINAALGIGLTFTPTADYNGSDTLTFTVNDQGFSGNDPGVSGTGGSEQDSDGILLTINAVVDIANDTVNIAEDAGAQNLTLLANDNFENAGRSITAVGAASHGTVSINDNNTVGDTTDDFVVYTAVADYNGSDSFTYTVTSGGVTETATVNVNISAVVDIADDTPNVGEDSGTTTIDVIANDSFENGGFSITAVTQGLHGTVAIIDGPDADANPDYVTYTPNADYNGSDSFTYTVTSGGVTETATVNVTITAVADIADDNVSVFEDSGANALNGIGNPVSLLANDNFESAARFISSVTQGVNGGTVAVHDNGTPGTTTDDFVTYTPAGDYFGPDTFTYTVTSGGVTETATVNVTVDPVNDPPTQTNLNTDAATWTEGGAAVLLDVGSNATIADIDSMNFDTGTLTVTISVGAFPLEEGLFIETTADISSTATTVSYMGTQFATYLGGGFAGGNITFTFDAEATPAAVQALIRAMSYNNNGGDNPTEGMRLVSWTLVDGDGNANGGSGTLLIGTSINVVEINDAPSGTANTVTTSEDDAYVFTTADFSFTDVDLNNLLSVTITTLATNGALYYDADGGGAGVPVLVTLGQEILATDIAAGKLTFLPDLDESSSPYATFTFQVRDDGGTTGGGVDLDPTANTMTINVTPDNIAPVVDLNDGTLGIDDSNGYIENSSGAGLGVSIAVSDAENDNIQGATITITDPEAGDELFGNLPLPGGITISGASTPTMLILTGSATPAQYAAALGQLGYRNTGEDPTDGDTNTNRLITVTVSDATGTSAPATMTMNIIARNDEPTLTATGLDPIFPEDAAAVDLFGSVTASTIEANQTLISMTLTVTNVTDGASEILTFDGSPVALTDGNTVVGTATNGLTVNVSVLGTTATVSFLGATLSTAALQTLVDGLAYRNSSDNPTDADRVVTITQVVDSGSNVAPNDSTTTLSLVSTVNVNPSNDPAAITGDASGTVQETGGLNNGTAGDPDDSGDLDSTDVDNLDDSWTAVLTATGTIGGYGTYILTAAGVWTYTLNDNHPSVEALNGAATLIDTFNAVTVDGTAQLVSVTINAQDDAAVANDDAFTTDEATAITTHNVLDDNGSGADADPDGGAAPTVTGVTGGTVGVEFALPSGALLRLNSDGTFTYNPNNQFNFTPAPGSGAANMPTPDSFSYTLSGGDTATVNVSITGIDTNDLLIGTAGADTLLGGVGNDTINGLAGNDLIDGGTGTDVMSGGGDNDVYGVDAATDQVNEASGGGTDRIATTVDYVLAAGSHVEILSARDHIATTALTLVGNGFGNNVYGNNGANILDGAGGLDVMVGFGGDDVYGVDNAGDQVIENAGEGTDRIATTVSYVLAAGSHVETLSARDHGTTTALNLVGNGFGNNVYGNNGDNILDGAGGADVMVGFGGNDVYGVDNAGDQVIEGAGGGTDRIATTVSYTLAAGSHVETLSARDHGTTNALVLVGNGFANNVYGNNGANFLDGRGGADVMAGFGGNDLFIVDNAGDVVLENAGAGTDTVYALTDYTLTAGSHVEALSAADHSAATALILTGNALANSIYGNVGANTLNGAGGADFLSGFGGADSFAFTTALGGGNVDVITDFSAADDTILLDDAVFAGLAAGALNPNAFVAGSAAGDADDRIIYNQATGQLFFDADGSGIGAQMLFAVLQGAPVITAAEFTVI